MSMSTPASPRAAHRTRPGWANRRLTRAALAVAGMLALAGCASAGTPSGSATYSGTGAASAVGSTPSISGSYPPAFLHTVNSKYGPIVLDSAGSAIYVFTADSPGHPACTGSCLTYWPPVLAPAQSAGVPSITATLGSLTLANGTHQLTVNGMPAYSYVGDTTSGDTTGEGVSSFGGRWWLVAPDGSAITGSAGSTQPSPSASSSSGGTRGGYGY